MRKLVHTFTSWSLSIQTTRFVGFLGISAFLSQVICSKKKLQITRDRSTILNGRSILDVKQESQYLPQKKLHLLNSDLCTFDTDKHIRSRLRPLVTWELADEGRRTAQAHIMRTRTGSSAGFFAHAHSFYSARAQFLHTNMSSRMMMPLATIRLHLLTPQAIFLVLAHFVSGKSLFLLFTINNESEIYQVVSVEVIMKVKVLQLMKLHRSTESSEHCACARFLHCACVLEAHTSTELNFTHAHKFYSARAHFVFGVKVETSSSSCRKS